MSQSRRVLSKCLCLSLTTSVLIMSITGGCKNNHASGLDTLYVSKVAGTNDEATSQLAEYLRGLSVSRHVLTHSTQRDDEGADLGLILETTVKSEVSNKESGWSYLDTELGDGAGQSALQILLWISIIGIPFWIIAKTKSGDVLYSANLTSELTLRDMSINRPLFSDSVSVTTSAKGTYSSGEWTDDNVLRKGVKKLMLASARSVQKAARGDSELALRLAQASGARTSADPIKVPIPVPQEVVLPPAPAVAEALPSTLPRNALVIGNATYAVGPLANPVYDAQAVAHSLQQSGFTVDLRTECTLEQMQRSLDDFGGRIRKGGVALFYYAGHGIQVHGENFLVPVEANLQGDSEAQFKCLNAGMVLAKMEDADTQVNIVILDACRNNPFARSFRSAARGLAVMPAVNGSMIVYSTAPGEVASDGPGAGNSPFAASLVRHITEPGVEVETMFRTVSAEVQQATEGKQVPWRQTSLSRAFYLVPKTN